MNYLVARQVVLAGNIANSSTPGYLAKDISFKPYVEAAQSKLAMRATSGKHMGGSMGMAGSASSESARFIEHNGNAVRLDEQVYLMGEVKGSHALLTQIYAKQAAMQRLALGRQQ